MSNYQQNVQCGWTGCSHSFGSEIDMNMHVMMNHMCILEHGEFVLNRGTPNRKRPVREPSPLPAALEDPAPEPPVPNPALQFYQPEPQVAPDPIPTAPALNLRRIAPEVPQNSHLVPAVAQEQKPFIGHTPFQGSSVNKYDDYGDVFQYLAAENPADNAPGPSEAPGTSGAFEDFIEDRQEQVEMDPGTFGIENQQEQVEMDMDNQLRDEEADMQAPEERHQRNIVTTQKLSDVIDEILERLRLMKRLGFIRQNRTVYCIVCLKYVKSLHQCNWKHTPEEDRVAEMWYRRHGIKKLYGKNQLVRELGEIKKWLHTEGEQGIDQ